MILQDFGKLQNTTTDSWFAQLLGWSRNKVNIEDNLDLKIMKAYVKTTETELQHTLGRAPRGIIPVAIYPLGSSNISWSRAPTDERIYITQAVAGECYFILF